MLALAALGVAAAGMAALTAYLLWWAADVRTVVRAGVVLFLFLMMAAMLAGLAVYLHAPSGGSAEAGLWVSGAGMSLAALGTFLGLLRTSRRTRAGADLRLVPLGHPRAFTAAVVLLVLVNELLMGWTFGAAQAGASLGLASTAGGLGAGLVSAVNSPWFLFTMAAEMAATAVLLRRRLPPPVQVILLTQAAIMAASPPALPVAAWVDGSTYVASAVMIGLIVFLMEHLYRHRQLGATLSRYLVLLLAVYGAMMAGQFLWLRYGDGGLFALSVAAEMVVFYDAVLRPTSFTEGGSRPWLLRPGWTFSVLSLIFVAELFMGAVLDLVVDPASFGPLIGSAAVSGPLPLALENAVSNGFWFLADVCASTWFLAMMGLEMGALVVLKLRETRNLENRIRLGLMLGCYAAFAVFYPSIYFQALAPGAPDPSQVPVLGWSMGLGSYPLAFGVFGAVALTYAVTGGLAALFGRRVICSTFCTAPLMYQGTTIDAMKSFNRSSPLARKYLSSRFSSAYSFTIGVVLVSLVGTSALSYLDSVGATHLTLAGADPAVFLFALYFSVLWYVLFVTIPYTGNYNCVTMGWCYTGVIVQAFQKVGFYSLRVKDKEVCRRCTTLDCAKACPVGLVDMPGHFRSRGEFRSSKCCGVGDCIEACPYGNMYISDIRHWVRRRLGRPDFSGAPRRLPMIAESPVPAPATAQVR